MLGVDGALLDWGKCKVGLSHVGYYLDNYIRAGTKEEKKKRRGGEEGENLMFTLLWVCCSVYSGVCCSCAVSRVLYRACINHV